MTEHHDALGAIMVIALTILVVHHLAGFPHEPRHFARAVRRRLRCRKPCVTRLQRAALLLADTIGFTLWVAPVFYYGSEWWRLISA